MDRGSQGQGHKGARANVRRSMLPHRAIRNNLHPPLEQEGRPLDAGVGHTGRSSDLYERDRRRADSSDSVHAGLVAAGGRVAVAGGSSWWGRNPAA